MTQNHAECKRGARLYSYASFPMRNEGGSHPIGKQTRSLDDLRTFEGILNRGQTRLEDGEPDEPFLTLRIPCEVQVRAAIIQASRAS